MRISHPNRWIYGGVLRPVEWTADDGRILLWNGSAVDVVAGDALLALFTGAPGVAFIGVTRNGEPVPVDRPTVAT